jgi:hypothetical protein
MLMINPVAAAAGQVQLLCHSDATPCEVHENKTYTHDHALAADKQLQMMQPSTTAVQHTCCRSCWRCSGCDKSAAHPCSICQKGLCQGVVTKTRNGIPQEGLWCAQVHPLQEGLAIHQAAFALTVNPDTPKECLLAGMQRSCT